MKKTIIHTLISILITASGIFSYHTLTKEQKLAYVKSGILLQNCKELKQGEEEFEKEMKIVKSNLDTLAQRYQRLEQQFKNGNDRVKKEIGLSMEQARENYQKYNAQASREMEERKQQISGKIIEKINVLIQEYGKSQNYEIIFGTTNEGSILYGTEAIDLTDEILKLLNEK